MYVGQITSITSRLKQATLHTRVGKQQPQIHGRPLLVLSQERHGQDSKCPRRQDLRD